MTAPLTKKAKTFAILVCIVAWFAPALQWYILLKNADANGLTVLQTTSRFFGYFTVLTNLLVAVSLTSILTGRSAWYRFFSRFSVQTAIAVFIFSVGLGYNLLLRHLWKPRGLQLLADELLHVAVPVLYVLYWLFFLPKAKLDWKIIPVWLLYPFVYLVVALLRGSLDGFYPYFFIDVHQLGYAAVAINAGWLFLAFILLSLLFIFLSRRLK